MHELRTDPYAKGDPDKTKPPTRVENVWNVSPGVSLSDGRPRQRPVPPASSGLSSNDAFTLYRAARDCMVAGAYTGATALLRRLILHVAVVKGNEAGTRDEAERLLAVAETLLGLAGTEDHSSNA